MTLTWKWHAMMLVPINFKAKIEKTKDYYDMIKNIPREIKKKVGNGC